MAENQVQSEKKMTSLNVSSETRDAIKDISTSLGLSQADTVARLVDGYHPNATPGVKAALDASAKAQADLNVSLLAQRDLMAEVAALKDRLAASEQRAAVAEAKVEVMTQTRGV